MLSCLSLFHKLSTALIMVFVVSGAAKAETIKIGLAVPLSGPFAEFGLQMKEGVSAAIEAFGKQDDLTIELVLADDKCNREDGKAAANQLVGAQVNAVIGHLCWGASLEGARIYAAADIPQITPGTRHASFTDEDFGKPGLRFRLIGRDDQFGPNAARILTDLSPNKRIAILHDGGAYGKNAATQLKDALNAEGIREARFEAFQPGRDEYNGLAVSLGADALDTVFIAAFHNDAALITKALRERDTPVIIVGGETILVDEFLKEAGPAANGVQAIATPDPRQLAINEDLLEAFRQKGQEPYAYLLPSYAAADIILTVIRETGATKGAELAEKIATLKHETVLGAITFNDKGDSDLPSYVSYIWQDGIYRHKDDE